jgi:hypothetical protein
MVNKKQTQTGIDIQDLKGRLAETGKKIAILRGYL